MISVFQRSHKLASVFFIVLLTSCASAPTLTDAGAHVREITAKQARSCKFVQTIQYNDRIFEMGKDPTVMKAIGENNLRNKVGLSGANAFVLTKDDSDWFLGTVAYQGDAYICSE
jgi:hypothetical protein